MYPPTSEVLRTILGVLQMKKRMTMMMNILAILWSLRSRLVEVLTIGWRIETIIRALCALCVGLVGYAA